jgi:hypothetical protein
MPNRPLNIPIRIVFYRDSDRWVAHCLEFDLMGDGQTKREAAEALGQAIGIQVEEVARSGNAQNLLNPAPAEYWKMYAQGRNVADGDLRIEMHYHNVEIPTEDFREYADCDSDPDLVLA